MIRTLNVDPMMITWAVLFGVLAALFLAFIVVALIRHNSKSKQKAKAIEDKKLTISDEAFFSYVGGKENIINFKLVGSRLTLELKDNSLVNKEALKKEKFDGIIEMKNKVILVKEDLSNELKALDNLKLD